MYKKKSNKKRMFKEKLAKYPKSFFALLDMRTFILKTEKMHTFLPLNPFYLCLTFHFFSVFSFTSVKAIKTDRLIKQPRVCPECLPERIKSLKISLPPLKAAWLLHQ